MRKMWIAAPGLLCFAAQGVRTRSSEPSADIQFLKGVSTMDEIAARLY